MNKPNCLSEQELSEFVQGRIDAIRVEQIAEHLEACDDCQGTVVMLGESSDTFVQQLRSPAVADALEAEAACQAAVQRLASGAADSRSKPTATLPEIGDIEQIGPYRIQGELGVGGMGTVFEAVHSKLRRTVALKILPASRWTNPLAIARFEREMEIIGQLDHPNIVRASDAGEENGMHYLVMEHVDGLDLSRIVARTGPLAIADACEIGRQAAIGLQYANENHLVHRDIKPSNLMLARKGQRSAVRSQESEPGATVKILDLGLAMLSEAHSMYENELTTVGQLMGTLDYMSPEQGMDSHEVDIRADIYSLGATLYKLLTGRAPFAAPRYNTLLKKVSALANQPAAPIKQLRPDVPDELAAIIDRMLAKDPQARFNSPDELAAALAPFARDADLTGLLTVALKADEPEAASLSAALATRNAAPTPATSSKTSQDKPASRKWIWGGLLAALVLLVAAAGIVIHIATDKGVLIVEADDDAELIIRKDGTTVKELQVSKGENTVTVRSGDYRIELIGENDSLFMNADTVTIKRGERTAVRIRQALEAAPEIPGMGMYGAGGEAMDGGTDPFASGESGEGYDPSGGAAGYDDGLSPIPRASMENMYGATPGMESMYGEMPGMGFSGPGVASDHKPDPTYDGKTYSQWLAELRTERKPERLTEAIRAFASLGEDDRELATRSVAVIMQIMRRNGQNVIDDTPRGKLVQQTLAVMLKMPSDIVIAGAEEELREGNTRSRSFVNFLLQNAFIGQGSPQSDFARTIERRRAALYELLLTLPDDEDADVRATAISLVIDRAKWHTAELSEIEGLVPRLRTAIKEKDLKLVALGARSLTKLEPDNKDLLPALIRLVSSNDHEQRVDAIWLLGRLGAKAQPALDRLVEIIRPIAEPKPRSPGAVDASAGGYIGGFGGGMGGYVGGYSPYHDIQYVAIEAIGKMGTAAKPALPLLHKIAELEPNASMGSDMSAAATAGGYDEGGGEGMSGGESAHIDAAKTAIARIEGKEPIPTPAEQDAADAFRPPGGGGYF